MNTFADLTTLGNGWLFYLWSWYCDCCCRQVTSVVSDSVRPHRGQPTRFRRPWDSPARTLEWVAISFSNAWKWKVKVKSLSRAWLFATPWTVAHQAPLSMGFSRQEYWSGVPLPSPWYCGNFFKKDSYLSTIYHERFTKEVCLGFASKQSEGSGKVCENVEDSG